MADEDRLTTGQQKIKGYRDLTPEEIQLINDIKGHGEIMGQLCDRIMNEMDVDHRWVSIGITHLQQGFMALTRAVAKPDSF